MKYIWLLGLWALLCSFSVCLASQNSIQIKMAVKVSDWFDKDLNLYTIGADLRMLPLGYFEIFLAHGFIIGKRTLSENPQDLVGTWPITQPARLLDWMKDLEPQDLYLQLPLKDPMAFQRIMKSNGDTEVILGNDTHISLEDGMYVLHPNIFNSYIKISEQTIRLREYLKNCSHYLSRI